MLSKDYSSPGDWEQGHITVLPPLSRIANHCQHRVMAWVHCSWLCNSKWFRIQCSRKLDNILSQTYNFLQGVSPQNPTINHMSGGQNYLLPAMDMAKVGGPLPVVYVLGQI